MNDSDNDTARALLCAVENNDEKTVRQLLQDGKVHVDEHPRPDELWEFADVAVQLQGGFMMDRNDPLPACTPLIHAAGAGYLSIVRCLVEHGANVNAYTVLGLNAMIHALFGDHVDVVRYLVEHAGVDTTTCAHRFTESLSTMAVRAGSIRVLRYLVEEAGLDVNTDTNARDETALMIAAQKNRLDAAQYLAYVAKADVLRCNRHGFMAFEMCTQLEKKENKAVYDFLVDVMYGRDVIRALLFASTSSSDECSARRSFFDHRLYDKNMMRVIQGFVALC